jgi:alpha-glucosidase (family GH31 glycosyl hydrolase)
MHHTLGSTAKVHNIYNLLWAKTIFEGFGAYRPGERVLNLTRSGFAGIQRFGAIPWSGDVARDFGGLAVQIPMMLNMGMSGLAYHNSDIGGYSRIPATPELYIRWMQYGTFCPIARAHGAGEVVHGYPTEPWQFGAEAEQICRTYIQLRYQLLPYIYTLAHENYETGRPLARPLFWENPNNNLYNESSSYLWGDAFLITPIVRIGQTSKALYLPEGTWVNFWTDEFLEGGKTINVAAPISVLPLFVKAGSIIPMAPIMNYSDERPMDTLTLKVYPVQIGTSLFTLYEDDGKTLAYQSGSYALTRFTQSIGDNGTTLQLVIGPSMGQFAGKLQRRSYVVELHGVSIKPTDIRSNGNPLREWSLTNSLQNKREGFSYDKATRILTAMVSVDADSSCQISIEGTRFRR